MKNHRLISLLLVLTLLAGILIPGAIAADEEELPAAESAVEAAADPEPEEVPEAPAPKEEPAEKPAEEPKEEPKEEPAEEPEEEPAEEPAEVPAEKPEEEPAGDPEEEPGEEPAPAGDVPQEPAGDEPQEQANEPVRFTAGYVSVPAGTAAYAEDNKSKAAGTFSSEAVAYAELYREAEDADKDWLKLTFDTEESKAEDAAFATAFVQAKDVSVLTDGETEALAASLSQDAREYKGNKLPTADFTEAEEADLPGEPEDEPEAQPETPDPASSLTVDPEEIASNNAAHEVKITSPKKQGEDPNPIVYKNEKAAITIKGTSTGKKITLQKQLQGDEWVDMSATPTWDKTAKNPYIFTISFKVPDFEGKPYQNFRIALKDNDGEIITWSPLPVTVVRAFNGIIASNKGAGLSQTAKLKAGTEPASDFLTDEQGKPTGTLKYQWYFSTDGANKKKYTGTGATTKTASIPISESGVEYTYEYWCVISADNGSATTERVHITRPFEPVITVNNSQPGLLDPDLYGEETPVTFTVVSASVPEDATIQWQKNTGSKWSNIKNQTASEYSINKIKDASYGTKYRALVTSGGKTVNSNEYELTRPYELLDVPTANIKAGIDAGVYLTPGVSDTCENPVYYWEASVDGESAWMPVSDLTGYGDWCYFEDAANKNLTIEGCDEAYVPAFRLRVEASNGRAISPSFKIAKPYKVTVKANPTAAGIGTKFTLTATVKNAPSTSLKYQWQRWDYNAADDVWEWDDIEDAEASTYSKKADEFDYDGVQFRCEVTAEGGDEDVIVRSGAVAIKRPFTLTTNHDKDDGIVYAGMDQNPQLKITKVTGATGTVKYQWYKQVYDETERVWKWSKISKATSKSYKPGKPTEETYDTAYRCLVTADNGKVYSREFWVVRPFSLTIQAGDEPIRAGLYKTVALEAEAASYLGDDYTLTFELQSSKDNGAKWTTYPNPVDAEHLSFNIDVDDDTYNNIYRIKGEAWKDGAVAYTMYSGTASIIQPFTPVASPEEFRQVAIGKSITFTVDTQAGGYQWFVTGDEGWEAIDGATGASYTLTVEDESIYGKGYRCEVNVGGEIAATNIVSVNEPFTVSVNSPKVTLGGTAKLTATLDNLEPDTAITGYAWQFSADGGETWQDVGGLFTAEEDKLTVSPTIAEYYNADESNPVFVFRCTVSVENEYIGSVDSNIAMIKKPFAVGTNSREQRKDTGSVSFKVTTAKAATTFAWQYSEDNGVTWKAVKKAQGKATNASDMKSSTLKVSVNYKTNVDNYCHLYRCKVTLSKKDVASETFYVEPEAAINYDYEPNADYASSCTLFTLGDVGGEEYTPEGEIVVPAGTHGVRVSQIGDNVFKGKTGITFVRIPKYVKSIGTSAFEGCSGVTKAELPNSVEEIGQAAFKDCSTLSEMEPYGPKELE